jgi:ribosomal protein S18 acetylase RimI-like enzyme
LGFRSFGEQLAMQQFEIRKAEKEDKKDILKLIESWKPYHWDLKPADEHFTRYFESSDFPQDRFFVGLMDNKIVSVIGYYHDHANEMGWLEWFYTHKGYSHLGIGKHMLEFVTLELKIKKAKKLFVNTSSEAFYEPAVNFYRKMGFRKIDAKENFYGKNEHQIIMSKGL